MVRFTTASGVRAVVATSIPAEALDKLARKLERQIARLLARPGGGSPESALQDEVACPVDQRDPPPA